MSESSLYEDIMQGLHEAIAYERGELSARTIRLTRNFAAIPNWTPDEIKGIRVKNAMTQRVFANFMGVSVKTVEAWESGRNRPNGSAARLMQVLAQEKIKLYTREDLRC